MYSNPFYQQQQQMMYQNPVLNMNRNMGGYYNQMNTGGYYNPYYAQEQQKKLEAQRREEERKQSDIWKKLSRNSNNIHQYVEDIDEHVKKYDPQEQMKEMEEENKYNKLLALGSLSASGVVCNNTTVINQTINAKIVRTKEEYPDDMDMGEYFEKAGELIIQARINRTRQGQRDISKLYKGADYKDLIKYHSSGGGYFGSTFGNQMNNRNINIDDMEVTLPNHIGGEYHQRRKAFLDSIMNTNVR